MQENWEVAIIPRPPAITWHPDYFDINRNRHLHRFWNRMTASSWMP